MTTLQVFWPNGEGPEKNPAVAVRGVGQGDGSVVRDFLVVPQMLLCDFCKKKVDVSVRETGGGFVARCVRCAKWIKNVSPRDMVRHGIARKKEKKNRKAEIRKQIAASTESREKKKAEVRAQQMARYRAMDYGDYLATPHWRDIRAGAIQRAGGRCQVCSSSTGLEVHHRTYDNLGDEKPVDLTVLCGECHELFHKNSRLRR